jgi:hypothetical protein
VQGAPEAGGTDPLATTKRLASSSSNDAKNVT